MAVWGGATDFRRLTSPVSLPESPACFHAHADTSRLISSHSLKFVIFVR